MYSDLFLAKQTAAKKLLDSPDPFSAWPSLSLKGVIELEWMALCEVLGTDVFGDTLATELLGAEGEEGGKVVRAMTDSAAARLVGAAPRERQAIARAWRQSADGLRGWSAAEVEELVAQLSDFAKRGQQTQASVLYFTAW